MTSTSLYEFPDPLKLWRVEDAEGANHHANLRNLLRGANGAFLVCGGPSLLATPYHKLAERGVWSMGVNNISGLVPVRAHISSDPPSKFHHGIWLDPAVLKFVPIAKLGTGHKAKIRIKHPDGSFTVDRNVRDCPSVFGFERRSWFKPDETFFTDEQAGWGNHDSGVEKTGEQKTVCTMLLGLRLLYYLGVRKIFLLGVDFAMRTHTPAGEIKEGDKLVPTGLGGYAFDQRRTEDNCQSNQEHFVIVNDWLCRLRPVFEQYGLSVYNCNPRSGLRAFDHCAFDLAIEYCRGGVPAEPFDLAGWYEK